ncbi:hypothetical protein [Streptomyces eurythermus]|uniref:hypothetical protein n=1 Tax=Streptomyces eurythermus TaxID=42237 RepID=UPI0034073E4D
MNHASGCAVAVAMNHAATSVVNETSDTAAYAIRQIVFIGEAAAAQSARPTLRGYDREMLPTRTRPIEDRATPFHGGREQPHASDRVRADQETGSVSIMRARRLKYLFAVSAAGVLVSGGAAIGTAGIAVASTPTHAPQVSVGYHSDDGDDDGGDGYDGGDDYEDGGDSGD